jgi:oxygen-independent coproporphyrinogen-3 oxidase
MTALSPAEQADEALLMGLRLAEGIDLDRLSALTGLAPREAALAELVRSGLIELSSDRRTGGRVRASAEGRIVVDRVVLRLSSALQPI